MLGALIGHLVGDYLLQNDWMALNKKARSLPCAVHCALWTLSVAFFAGWWEPHILALLWLSHLAQDRTNVIGWYMRTVGQRQFASGPCAPWSIIVVDNTWHVVALWAISHLA